MTLVLPPCSENQNIKQEMVSIQSEGAAREWSTVVKISILPLSFKPVPLSLSRSPLL